MKSEINYRNRLIILYIFGLFLLAGTAQAATFTVTNTNDSVAGSFRQAILNANGNPGSDTITFNISGSGVRTITPLENLPEIGRTFSSAPAEIIIDATTQPGYAGTPLIEINASNMTIGLHIYVCNSLSPGLIINRASSHGIYDCAMTVTITDNYIGTNPNDTTDLDNGDNGIFPPVPAGYIP